MHATSQTRRTVAERKLVDPARRARRRSRLIGVGLILGTLLLGVILVTTGNVPLESGPATPAAPVPKADISVDFGRTLATDDAASIGVDESTYGTPSDIHDPTAQQLLQKLGVGYARLWVTLANPASPSSRITCAAAGCDTGLNVDNWVQMMDAAGEVPVAGIPDTLSAADAAAIVRHFTGFASGGEPITTWIIGNEPESIDENVTTYDARFNALYDAMKKADPSIKIGGPATLGFDGPFLRQFLADCGSRADFVDFHFYPGHETAAQLLAGLPGLSQDLGTLRDLIKNAQPARADTIAIHVGEWNFSADPGTLGEYAFTGFASVLDADILGRILTAGGDSLAWGSKNGPMSLLYGDVLAAGGSKPPAGYTQDTPMPLYEGISMFTGQGLFPRFGTNVVSATSIVPGVDAFASASPDEIVIVNTSAKKARLTVRGNGGSPRHAEVWQLHQTGRVTAAPVSKGTIAASASGTFTVTLPPDSVTTLVLTASTAPATPTQS
jgi:hypothetical protein